jgi:hypothetical protein
MTPDQAERLILALKAIDFTLVWLVFQLVALTVVSAFK